MEQNNILEVKGISKSFPGVKALSQVDFSVRKGEILALAGENGAGKSTLMKILSGSYTKDEGEIWFDGQAVDISSPRAAERMGLSIIHQELSVFANVTVAENIYMGRQPRKAGIIDWPRMNRDAEALFARLGIAMNVKRKVRGMSVAEQQMVEIARALSYDAKVVIMDEPTSSLTTKEAELLFAMMEDLRRQNVAVIFITHRLDEIFHIANRVTVLRDGQSIGTKEIGETSKAELISMMIGRELTKQYPERQVEMGEVLLQVEDLTDGKKVKGVSFKVHKGEVLGIAGLVGAGRTETVRLVFGADKKTGGHVTLAGKEIHIRSPKDSVRNQIALVTEDRKSEGLLLRSAVKQNIVMVALHKIKTMGLLSMKKEREAGEATVKSLRITTPSANQKVMFLSGGNQQKVVLGKWLFSDSQVIIMDEPTRGIDVGAKREIYEIINQLAAQGKAIVVVSSEIEEVMGISDRIVVMHEGRIAGEVEREDFSQGIISEYAIGGKRI